MSRCVVVPVSIPLWQELMTVGNEISARCVEGLPEGAELVSSYHEGNPPTAHLVFHHESFVDVPVGGQLPHLTPMFERLE